MAAKAVKTNEPKRSHRAVQMVAGGFDVHNRTSSDPENVSALCSVFFAKA
jgi:hypothetical protein